MIVCWPRKHQIGIRNHYLFIFIDNAFHCVCSLTDALQLNALPLFEVRDKNRSLGFKILLRFCFGLFGSPNWERAAGNVEYIEIYGAINEGRNIIFGKSRGQSLVRSSGWVIFRPRRPTMPDKFNDYTVHFRFFH